MDLLQNVMQGKFTKRGCYGLMLGGLYLMAYNLGQDLLATHDPFVLASGVLTGQGFMYFALGWIGYGLRRAMMKGGKAEPEPSEEDLEMAAGELKSLLSSIEGTLKKRRSP